MLADAMLKIIVDEGLLDEGFVQARTTGYEELESYLDSFDLSQAADLCGLDVELIREAAVSYAMADTGMVLTARGVEQQTDGHLAVRRYLNLVLATGKIGREGCGYGAITGQGTVREEESMGRRPISCQATDPSRMRKTGHILPPCGALSLPACREGRLCL